MLPLALAYAHPLPGGERITASPGFASWPIAGLRFAAASAHARRLLRRLLPVRARAGRHVVLAYTQSEAALSSGSTTPTCSRSSRAAPAGSLRARRERTALQPPGARGLALLNVARLTGDAGVPHGRGRSGSSAPSAGSPSEGWFWEYEGRRPRLPVGDDRLPGQVLARDAATTGCSAPLSAPSLREPLCAPGRQLRRRLRQPQPVSLLPRRLRDPRAAHPRGGQRRGPFLEGVATGTAPTPRTTGSSSTGSGTSCRPSLHRAPRRRAARAAAEPHATISARRGSTSATSRGATRSSRSPRAASSRSSRTAGAPTATTGSSDGWRTGGWSSRSSSTRYRAEVADGEVSVEGTFGFVSRLMPSPCPARVPAGHAHGRPRRLESDPPRPAEAPDRRQAAGPLRFKRTVRFGAAVSARRRGVGRGARRARAGRRSTRGTDHTAIYVAMSQVFHDSALQPWTDLGEDLATLAGGRAAARGARRSGEEARHAAHRPRDPGRHLRAASTPPLPSRPRAPAPGRLDRWRFACFVPQIARRRGALADAAARPWPRAVRRGAPPRAGRQHPQSRAAVQAGRRRQGLVPAPAWPRCPCVEGSSLPPRRSSWTSADCACVLLLATAIHGWRAIPWSCWPSRAARRSSRRIAGALVAVPLSLAHGSPPRKQRLLRGLGRGPRGLGRSRRLRLAGTLALTLGLWVLHVVQIAPVLPRGGAHAPALAVFALVPVALLVGLLPLTPRGARHARRRPRSTCSPVETTPRSWPRSDCSPPPATSCPPSPACPSCPSRSRPGSEVKEERATAQAMSRGAPATPGRPSGKRGDGGLGGRPSPPSIRWAHVPLVGARGPA